MSDPAKKLQLQASIIPVLFKKGHIEKHKADITDFAKAFRTANSKQGKTITRHDVEWYWEGNVRCEFDTVDPLHNHLISQIKSPKFEMYWTNKTAIATLQAKTLLQEQEDFRLLNPNNKEKKHHKNALVLGNGTERWIVPEVFLMALYDVSFEDFVQGLRTANTTDASHKLDESKAFRLWAALIKKAYDFVPKEVQVEKLKEAFSRHPPTTEAGLEEFFAAPSKKRKSAPDSEGHDSDKEYSGGAQKRRRVSIGETHIRTFDEDSTLDPTLEPILSYTYKPSSGAIAGSSASAPPRSSIKVNGSQGLEDPVDLTEKKVQALEKELAKLKLANDEAEHKYRSERGMRRAAEQKVESLQEELQESQDLVAQLQKRSTKDL